MASDPATPTQPAASVLLLCGLPASGKSTFARTIIDLHEQHRRRYQEHDNVFREGGKHVVIHPSKTSLVQRYDKILLIGYDFITQQELTLCDDKKDGSNDADLGSHASFDSNDLEAWRRSRVRALENLQEALTAHFTGTNDASSLLIIMDDNFHLRSMRRDVYRTCQDIMLTMQLPSFNRHCQARIGFSTMYFSTPLEVCQQRNALRKGKERIPVNVMNRMAAVMESPDATKPYASFERFHVSVDNSGNPFDANLNAESREIHELDECIQKSLQSPVLPKMEISQEETVRLEQQRSRQREETLKCQSQRIDQLLRKLVGAVGRVDKKRSKEANETRKSIMERIRRDGELFDMSDESVVQHYACTILGIEETDDWKDLHSPLADSIKDSFQQFQKERT